MKNITIKLLVVLLAGATIGLLALSLQLIKKSHLRICLTHLIVVSEDDGSPLDPVITIEGTEDLPILLSSAPSGIVQIIWADHAEDVIVPVITAEGYEPIKVPIELIDTRQELNTEITIFPPAQILKLNRAKSGKDGCLAPPPHTTKHAGPHLAVPADDSIKESSSPGL